MLFLCIGEQFLRNILIYQCFFHNALYDMSNVFFINQYYLDLIFCTASVSQRNPARMLAIQANQRKRVACAKANIISVIPVDRLVEMAGFSLPKTDGISAIEKMIVPTPNIQSCQSIIILGAVALLKFLTRTARAEVIATCFV